MILKSILSMSSVKCLNIKKSSFADYSYLAIRIFAWDSSSHENLQYDSDTHKWVHFYPFPFVALVITFDFTCLFVFIQQSEG